MISDRLPDPSDLAVTLSQRLAELLSPAGMARLRVLSREPVNTVVLTTALDVADAAGGAHSPYATLSNAIFWAMERYGVETSALTWPHDQRLVDLGYEAVRIARSHGYVVEAILDSQEATP